MDLESKHVCVMIITLILGFVLLCIASTLARNPAVEACERLESEELTAGCLAEVGG